MEPMDSSWIVVDEREGVGRVDTWSEYLCVSRTDKPETFDIAICRYEVVGEIPTAWFDDEGQPLPEYSDVTGSLKLPQFYEYRYAGRVIRTKLSGHDGEYLLGELVFDETYGGPISVRADELVKFTDALSILQWVTADVGGLFALVKRSIS